MRQLNFVLLGEEIFLEQGRQKLLTKKSLIYCCRLAGV